ncbi:hypothetical protein B6D60_01270 [candidate division KSB1 bacterium 4484_87]|nr:MAG: hypothetical protein B6D60_01270 [candidate division KSB1 bacterium 4484_87]
MKKLQFILIFVFILQANLLPGKNGDLSDDGKHFVNIGRKLFTAPARFQKSDWGKFGVISATTGILFLIDDNVQNIALKNQNQGNDRIFCLDRVYGNKYTLLATAGIYGIGVVLNKPVVRKMGLNATESFLYSALLSSILKMAIGRHRPYTGHGHLFFSPFQIEDTYQSLPSGHATVSMAVSAAMAKSLDNFWWKLLWYSSGGLVSASRIYHNRHWASDVFLGAAIGYFVADFVAKFDKISEEKSAGMIRLFHSKGRLGVAIDF